MDCRRVAGEVTLSVKRYRSEPTNDISTPMVKSDGKVVSPYFRPVARMAIRWMVSRRDGAFSPRNSTDRFRLGRNRSARLVSSLMARRRFALASFDWRVAIRDMFLIAGENWFANTRSYGLVVCAIFRAKLGVTPVGEEAMERTLIVAHRLQLRQ